MIRMTWLSGHSANRPLRRTNKWGIAANSEAIESVRLACVESGLEH